MVITLCGSTRFKEEFENVAMNLTLQGHIILMPCVFHHYDEIELSQEQKIQLDNLHKQKIMMSEAIYVINKNGYIGNSTYGEIDWAYRLNKQIYYLEEIPTQDDNSNTNETIIEDNEQEIELSTTMNKTTINEFIEQKKMEN